MSAGWRLGDVDLGDAKGPRYPDLAGWRRDFANGVTRAGGARLRKVHHYVCDCGRTAVEVEEPATYPFAGGGYQAQCNVCGTYVKEYAEESS